MCIDTASQADYECALNVDRDGRSARSRMGSKVIETSDQVDHECRSILMIKPIRNVDRMGIEMADLANRECESVLWIKPVRHVDRR